VTYGATPSEWTHFDLILGLGADLLPVVSNPNAKISDKSDIKKIGKTPSEYNANGKVRGFPDWTSLHATPEQIEQWSSQPDYGICLQTRNVRALDIDITDQDKADAIAIIIDKHLGKEVACRYRDNSAKFLIAFRVNTTQNLFKRVLPVGEERIEFLASGQQFVAIGHHESGVRYQWGGGLPDDFPFVELEKFEAMWTELETSIGTGKTQSLSHRRSKTAVAVESLPPDDTLTYLEKHKFITGWGREGQAFVNCPFAHEHTDGNPDMAYFRNGSRGYGKGSFVCLHAHCQGRDTLTLYEGLRLEHSQLPKPPGHDPLEDFDVLEPLVSSIANERQANQLSIADPKGLKRNKGGDILATLPNLEVALCSPAWLGERIGFDSFKDEVMSAPANGINGWQAFDDDDYTRLRILLERKNFQPIGRELMRDSVKRVAKMNRFDSAIEWINSLKWDGKERVKRFMPDYMGADDTSYTQAVASYMWCALAGRVLSPGCKADAAPVFVGDQYIGKSFAVASIAPDPQFFTEIRFDEQEDNLSRKMRGRLVAEFAELRGLHSREMEAIKAFITRQYENWIPKYQEFATIFPRRLLFIGTTNKDEFLADDTGNRRWFPVKVYKADTDAIIKDRLQLWAEGKEIFNQQGIKHYYDMANNLASEIHQEYMMSDVWEDVIARWLDTDDAVAGKPSTCDFLQVTRILSEALNVNSNNMRKIDAMRVASILKKLGYKKHVKRVNGINTKVWMR
jgi:predicted P-loop ATPase